MAGMVWSSAGGFGGWRLATSCSLPRRVPPLDAPPAYPLAPSSSVHSTTVPAHPPMCVMEGAAVTVRPTFLQHNTLQAGDCGYAVVGWLDLACRYPSWPSRSRCSTQMAKCTPTCCRTVRALRTLLSGSAFMTAGWVASVVVGHCPALCLPLDVGSGLPHCPPPTSAVPRLHHAHTPSTPCPHPVHTMPRVLRRIVGLIELRRVWRHGHSVRLLPASRIHVCHPSQLATAGPGPWVRGSTVLAPLCCLYFGPHHPSLCSIRCALHCKRTCFLDMRSSATGASGPVVAFPAVRTSFGQVCAVVSTL